MAFVVIAAIIPRVLFATDALVDIWYTPFKNVYSTSLAIFSSALAIWKSFSVITLLLAPTVLIPDNLPWFDSFT